MRKSREIRHRGAFRWVCAGLIFSALSSWAQQPAPFQMNAERRTAFVDELRQRRFQEKTNAVVWAQAHGVPVREVKDGCVRELMSIQNGLPLYYITLNKNAAISTAADLVRDDSSFGVNGSGIRVGVWDGGGILTNHIEFGGRVEVKDGSSATNHATHVAGIIGAGGTNTSVRGMAPGVLIDSYDWDYDIDEVADAGASASGQDDAVYLSNHSYSYDVSSSSYYYLFGLYGNDTRDIDGALHGLQYCLPFVAAGNSGSIRGYDTISLFGPAKNVMTVGSVNDAVSGGLRSLSSVSLSYFSSCGPADDGRIKPDIVANGEGLASPVATTFMSYESSSGTSMASPNACGSAALLVDYYRSRTGGGALRASTLKGLIIHTADDLGRDGPDYQYGWGLMNTLAAAAVIRDYVDGNTERIVESALSSGDTLNYTVSTGGEAPLRVTLCWTDPPGSSNGIGEDVRTSALVNDLDLKVIGPSGTVYYPFSLSYADPTAVATTTGRNAIDNVEQVLIEVPEEGDYTITIDADGYVYKYVDGRLRGVGEQNFSLLVSGLDSDSDGDGLPDEWERTYFGGITNALTTADADGDGADNLTEYVSGCNPTNAGSVFGVTNFSSVGESYVISWAPVEGHVYSVEWATNLFDTFTPIATNLTYPACSYTDRIDRAGPQNFYRLGVEQ